MTLFSTLLVAACLAQDPGSPAPGRADGPLPAPLGVRVEHFVIDAPSGASTAEEGPEGVVEIALTPSPHGPIREREVRFREGPIHVREVETEGPGRPQAVWRETGPTWGRSWLAVWDPVQGSLETTHWGPAKEIHGTASLAVRPFMPLELLELCRSSDLDGQGFDCLDPTSGTVVFLEIRVHEPSALVATPVESAFEALRVQPVERSAATRPAEGPARLVEWHRCDGSLAGRFLFEGRSLSAFQWQDGERWARRVDALAYQQARDSWFAEMPSRTNILERTLEALRRRSL